jgi:hypothetical protein
MPEPTLAQSLDWLRRGLGGNALMEVSKYVPVILEALDETMNTSNSVSADSIRRAIRGVKFPVGYVYRGIELDVVTEIQKALAAKPEPETDLEITGAIRYLAGRHQGTIYRTTAVCSASHEISTWSIETAVSTIETAYRAGQLKRPIAAAEKAGVDSSAQSVPPAPSPTLEEKVREAIKRAKVSLGYNPANEPITIDTITQCVLDALPPDRTAEVERLNQTFKESVKEKIKYRDRIADLEKQLAAATAPVKSSELADAVKILQAHAACYSKAPLQTIPNAIEKVLRAVDDNWLEKIHIDAFKASAPVGDEELEVAISYMESWPMCGEEVKHPFDQACRLLIRAARRNAALAADARKLAEIHHEICVKGFTTPSRADEAIACGNRILAATGGGEVRLI